MSIEKSLYSLVTNNSAISALIGGRFYPQHAAQAVTDSYCTYNVISIVSTPEYTTENDVKQARVQVDCFGSDSGDSYSKSVAISEAIQNLYGTKSTVLSTNFLLITTDDQTDIFSKETGRNYRSIDLLIHYKEI